MSTSSLENKTIRPGSLKGFSYYHSNRLPQSQAVISAKKRPVKLYLFAALAVLIGFLWLSNSSSPNGSQKKASSSSKAVTVATGATQKAQGTPANRCADNSLDKLVKISIIGRHMWICEGNKKVYDSAVITGLQNHPETETPLGTYKIYAKVTDTTLTGSDSRGSWSDPVSYWMPFLDNQFGAYGFHDATWRSNTDFGRISPSSSAASHGCVELPLAASKWLYNWAQVGTTVTVET